MATDWKQQYYRYQKHFLSITALYKRRQDLRMFLEITLSLVTIALFGIFALKPTILTIVTLTQDIKQKRQTIQKLETKIKNINQAQTLYNQELSRISLLDSAIPSTPAVAQISRQLEGIANQTNVQVLGVSVKEVALVDKPNPEPQSIDLSLNSSGPYSNLIGYLGTIDTMRRPLDIKSINFNLASSSNNEQVLIMTVSGQLPFLPENEK